VSMRPIPGVMLERDQRLEELGEISGDISRATQICQRASHAG
jgi:hypothetical protein